MWYIYYSYISTYIPFYRIQFLYISRYFNQYIPYIFAQLDLARFARLFPRDPSTWRGIPSAPRCAWRWLGRWRHWRNVEGKTLGSMGISQIVLISSALPRTNQPSLDVDLGTSKHWKNGHVMIDGHSRILKWRYVSTIFLAIFCGDIPWN